MKRGEVWETAALLGALASVWPRYILGWQGTVWRVIPYVMLAVLVLMLVCRLRRVRQECHQRDRGKPRLL